MFKSSGLLWSLAVLGSTGTGIFLGLGSDAHSDISKFNALLSQHERMPGEVIVKVKPNALYANSLAQVFDADRFHISEIRSFQTDNQLFTVKLAGDEQTAQFLETSSSNPAIEYAEPNYIVHTLDQRDESPSEVIPNVSDFNLLWGLKNGGQKDAEGNAGVVGADIGATKAWAITKGNRAIKVAVIDTGVDYNHPELKDNIFNNDKEIPGNGIDDDGNGFIDDIHGWNFAGVSTNNPMDDNEHGTHCSGTIGASGAGGKIVGVNQQTSIIPLKFLTGSGSGSLEDAVKAIQYATKIGANVMSNSWGGGGFSQTMFDAIKEAKGKGILFVAAAGNDSSNADNNPHYPAGYQLDNVIAVAASTNRDTLASFSTYGKRSVHIAAPGNKIYSTIPGGKYDTLSGTSMATPHVSGAVALLWGTNPSMSYLEVKERILKSRDFVASFTRKVASSGRLNVYNAIMEIYPPSPEPAEDAWKDYDIGKTVESTHPYANNQKQEFVIDGPADAKYMRVVLSKVDLEDGYDFLKIVDANGSEVDSISGKAQNSASFYVSGNKMTLKFSSDSSEARWGFAVSKVQVVY